MGFEWDPRKAATNFRKHGVDFRFAVEAFRDPERVERLDDSEDYGETRWHAIGLAGQALLAVIYVLRGDDIRIISARKADRNEFQSYWNR